MSNVKTLLGCLLAFSAGTCCADTSLAASNDFPRGYPIGNARPPAEPHISPELTEEQDVALPIPKQPPELAQQLESLSTGSIEERVEKLKKKVISDQIFVEGGTYMMGDFGPLLNEAQLPYTPDSDNKPAHKVTLSSFSISKYKTTYAEFDVFTDATKRKRAGMEMDNGRYRSPTVPAGVYWKDASDYCQWIGHIVDLPIGLPTEAQWEFSARSRGQIFVFSTSNGNLDIGVNIPNSRQIKRISPLNETEIGSIIYPVGMFPPNPIGLHDMNSNAEEWVNDFYDDKYYQHSVERDPKGPLTGKQRVERGYGSGGDFVAGLNFIRHASDPIKMEKNLLTGKMGPGTNIGDSFRCAVERDLPVVSK